jgi:hypothetical protein
VTESGNVNHIGKSLFDMKRVAAIDGHRFAEISQRANIR